MVAGSKPPGIRESQMIAERNRDPYFSDSHPQINPAPGNPPFVAALKCLIATRDSELQDIALRGSDVRDAFPKSLTDCASFEIAGNLGCLVDCFVGCVLDGTARPEIGH